MSGPAAIEAPRAMADTPGGADMAKATREERFWAKVNKGDGTGCWLWTGANNGRGYGQFGRPPTYAHRISYEFYYGPIPQGLCVLHRCDNPPCVRPDHLWLGTKAQNSDDMARKGRAPRSGGPGAKLSMEKAAEIRVAFSRGESNKALAAQYGCSPSTISDVLYGRRWVIRK
jgi:HNH endonuclease